METTRDSIKLSKAEAHFRSMAFRIVYNQAFANVGDLTTRFACAIAYSAQEIGDPRLFQIWWAWTGGKSIKALLCSGQEPPPELRTFVGSYLWAIGERARETGDPLEELM